METVKFTVPGAPKGKARARTVRSKKGGTFSYTPEGTMLYENLILANLPVPVPAVIVING